MKTWRMVLTAGLLATSVTAWAQTGGQSGDTFGSPDIYNTGKTGSKTLPLAGANPSTNSSTNSVTNPAGSASADLPYKRALQEIYNKCVAATKKRDELVLAALRTQDFTFRDAKGKVMSRGDVEAGERLTLTNAVSIDKVSSQVESVQTSGGKVTATLHHYYAETANDAQNKPHKMALTTNSQEIWTTAGNAWKLQSVKVLSQQETVDGKPYDPNAQNNTNKQTNNQNNGNRQAGRNNRYNGYNGYRAPRIKTPKIRTFGGNIIGG